MDGNSTTLIQDNEEEEEVVEEEHGLDTINPILTIDGKIKLIGEYEETIGTCLVFSENDAAPVVHEESGPSEANLFLVACIVDSKQAPAKQVMPITRLHKILKFRLMDEEAERIGSIEKQMNDANE